MRKLAILTALVALAAFVSTSKSEACTNLIVTKGASVDGSVMVSYSADSHTLYGALYKYNKPARPYGPGATIPIREWSSGRFLIDLPQVPVTYNTIGNVNEHQLMIAETTAGGRPELRDPDGKLVYASLIYTALQRCKTAREAILTMVELANTHGYAATGESFSVCDPNEAWIFEFIGKGSNIVDGVNTRKGIVWVARRIPDGYVSAHANHARITTFPLDDPENTMYAPDVISFAREMGYFDGPDEEFSFSDAYIPLTFSAMRGCEARVWSWFRQVACESYDMYQYLDYAMGHNPKNRMPLWVKPKRKLSVKDLMDGMRDHYQGTPLAMTTDIGAGGEESPYRWRPMTFEWEGKEYVNERAIATQQTGFWFVAQARSWLPDPVGCILWFGTDDAATSPLTPIYCATTEVPWCFSPENGHMTEYSPTSMYWLTNRVAQFCYLRYNVVGAYVRGEVDRWENEQIAKTAEVDAHAARLYAQNPAAAVEYLTRYSVETAQELFDRWKALDSYILVRFKDGNNMRVDENGNFLDNGFGWKIPPAPEWPGYSDTWKRNVVREHGETLRVRPVEL
ncbi:MAG: C69 family dipeptidase [Rikenellaceae bacterium]|nr:C69 family dipeptidase [Rikenellaceae bacterium]MCL2692518.1 C69 family dipeptidase [Rikenellaceae bacterium]